MGYWLGYSRGVLDGENPAFELGVDAQRRVKPLVGGTDTTACSGAPPVDVRWRSLPPVLHPSRMEDFEGSDPARQV